MGRNDKDKWLGKLKDSVENHSEPLPDSFWEELKRDIPNVPPAGARRKISEPLVLIMAAAAVVLLALVLFIHQWEEPAALQIAVTEHNKLELQGQAVSQGKRAGELVSESVPVNLVAHEKILDCTVQNDNAAALQEPENSIAEAEVENAFDGKREVVPEGNRESGVNKKSGVIRESDREEYLKELEYLREDGAGRVSRLGKMVAVVVGSSGMVTQNSDKVSVGGSIHNSPAGAVLPSQGMGNLWSENVPETFAAFINMAIQPVENITWLGGNSPSPFNNSMVCKSYNYNHREPVRLGLSFAVGLVGGLYAESGISYQYLASEMLFGGAENAMQKLHYIGIPIRLGMNFMRGSRFQVYLSGGYMIEKCVYGVLELPNERDLVLKLPGVMNSVNVAAGLQFMVGDHTALYLEPGMYSYIGIGDEIGRSHGYIIKNRYSNNPTGFSVQGGLRFLF